MTWEHFLTKAIPYALIGLGVIVLKLWRSQAVTDLLCEQLKGYPDRMAAVEAGLGAVRDDTGEIKSDVKDLTKAFNEFVRANGGT